MKYKNTGEIKLLIKLSVFSEIQEFIVFAATIESPKFKAETNLRNKK